MNCIIANSKESSREGIRAYLQDDAWQVYAAGSESTLQHILQQCCEGIMLYYIPFCNADAAMLHSTRKKYPRIQVIAYAESSDVYNLRQCIHEKVAAWMSSSAAFAEISVAMQAVIRSRAYHCDAIQQVMERYCIKPGCKSLFSITELDLLTCIARDHSTGEISKLLYKSDDTIYNIRKRMMKKTGTGNIAALLWYAIEHGYLQCDSNKKATL